MIMGDRQKGGMVRRRRLKKCVQDELLVFRIEVTGGFVGKNQFWIWQQGAADGYPLPLPVGEGGWMMLEPGVDSELLSELKGPLPDWGGERE